MRAADRPVLTLPTRATHVTSGKVFDRIFMVPIPEPDLLSVETALILLLEPEYNRRADGSLYTPGKERHLEILGRHIGGFFEIRDGLPALVVEPL